MLFSYELSPHIGLGDLMLRAGNDEWEITPQNVKPSPERII